MSGKWLRRSNTQSVVIFIHGLFSENNSAWRSESAFWPNLLLESEGMSHVDVYTFDYETGVFAGNYSLGDIVDLLAEYISIDKIGEYKNIVFVAHSMGGVIARRYFVKNRTQYIGNDKTVGFFLVASPSLGSKYANLFSAIARIHNSQVEALRFDQNNGWLNDLDREFFDLAYENKPYIIGRELIEANPTSLPRFLFRNRQVVTPIAAARYFGKPLKIPGSDHNTIAKPLNKNSLQHRMLIDFLRPIGELTDRENRRLVSIHKSEITSPSTQSIEATQTPYLLQLAAPKIDELYLDKSIEELTDNEIIDSFFTLMNGRLMDRKVGWWLVENCESPVRLFENYMETQPLFWWSLERASAILMREQCSERQIQTYLSKIEDSGNLDQKDKKRQKLLVLGAAGGELPRSFVDDANLEGYSFFEMRSYYARAYLRKAFRSKDAGETENALYNFQVIYNQASSDNDGGFHFFDLVRWCAGMPVHVLNAALKKAHKYDKTGAWIEALLFQASKYPEGVDFQTLYALSTSKEDNHSRDAKVAISYAPSKSNVTSAKKRAIVNDYEPANYNALALDYESYDNQPKFDAKIISEAISCSRLTGSAIAKIGQFDESVKTVLLSQLEHLKGLQKATILAEMVKYDPDSVRSLIKNSPEPEAELEKLLLLAAKYYYDGFPDDFFVTLSYTGEDKAYLPFLEIQYFHYFQQFFLDCANGNQLLKDVFSTIDYNL